MKNSKFFASDNSSGVHPDIMDAILRVNRDHAVGYGDDPYTKSAIRKFRDILGDEIEVFFVYGGTGANVAALKTVTESFNSIICASTSHINTDECGAPEKFLGTKLCPIPSSDGKITSEQIKANIRGKGDPHHSQEKVVSITQSTEMGTVYTQEEIRKIAETCKNEGLVLHMDGARICNAAASLGISLKEATTDTGIDIMSFGGTKNGMMYGEAVIFFNTAICNNFKFFRKQGMQLASKMRYIAVQFDALLTDGLWLKNASHANEMARKLEESVSGIMGVEILQKVEANAVFAKIPREIIEPLRQNFFFYTFDDSIPMVRWMTSWDTTPDEIERFSKSIQSLIIK